MNKTKYLMVIFFAVTISSCQPILKIITGIKNPKVNVSESERLAYYEPFIKANSESLKIYTLTDTVSLKMAFKRFNDFPHVIAHNIITDHKYRIHCYDDVATDIEDMNKGEFKLLTKIPDSSFNKTKLYFGENSKLVFNQTGNSTKGEWDIYVVSGTFLGEKLKKRTLPITKLNNIKSMSVLDLSLSPD